MKRILTEIHAHLRESRMYGGTPVHGDVSNTKRYDRFPLTALPTSETLSIQLSDVLARRVSRSGGALRVRVSHVGDLLQHSAAVRGTHRPYPSGGALYPVEIYLLAYDVDGLAHHSYHYRPDLHALEKMFPLGQSSADVLTGEHAHYPLVFVFTACWARSHGKYHDFALELALMETGHLMQNVQLVGTALSVSTCPMGGFRDDALVKMLDLDSTNESVLCALVVGNQLP